MSNSDMLGLAAGLLQLTVACYALRLNWRFGTSRVGWLIFGAFALLAFMHCLLALNPFRVGLASSIWPDLTYAAVSVLLLTSIIRLESSLKKHWQERNEAQRNLSAWGSEMQAQVVELARSNEELRHAVTRRQVETEEQKKIREESDKTFQALLTGAQQTEKDLLQTISSLREELAEQKRQLVVARQSASIELDAARRAAEAEVADREATLKMRQAGVAAGLAAALEQLRSLEIFAEKQARSSNSRIVQSTRLLQKSARRHATAGTEHRSRKTPAALSDLARHFTESHAALRQEIEVLSNQLKMLAAQETGDGTSADQTRQEALPFHEPVVISATETGTEPTDPETSHVEDASPAAVHGDDISTSRF